MSTQQRPQAKNVFTKRFLALFVVLALIAAACGGSSENDTGASADDAFGPVVENNATAVDDGVDARSADESSDQPAAEDTPAPEVLAFAIQAAEESSYTYEQGLSIEAELFGQRVFMGGDEAFATGQVNGDDVSINADIGSFMVSLFESLGLSADDPLLGEMLGGFGDLEMDVWMVDGVIVMDLSDFANTLGALDPAAANELAIFQDGPVSVDLAQLESFGGVAGSTDAAAIVGQFGQGAQITDPADIVAALRNVDALVEEGVDTVNGVAVEVYSAEIAFAEYAEALDQDLTAGLDQMGAIDGSVDPDALVAALESIVVDLTVSIDEQGLVREIGTVVDMGAFANAISAEMDNSPAGFDFEMIVETWQTFDNYGEDLEIVAPDAVDRTSELAGLLTS